MNMDQDASDGSTCRCKGHNHFTVRAAQTLVIADHQMRKTRGRDKDKLLLGMLTASHNEAAVSDAHTCIPFENTIKYQPVCKPVFCRLYPVGATRLKRIQKLLRSGVCAHAS